MKIVKIAPGQRVWLGHRGENLATRIIFSIAPWVECYGAGTAHLLHQRNGDSEPYPVATVQEGTEVSWDITDGDTALEGYGKYELRYYVGESLAKSSVGETYTNKSLQYGTEPPEPIQGWLDHVAEKEHELLEAVGEAKTAAEQAAGSAGDALAFANAAEESVRNAGIAVKNAADLAVNADLSAKDAADAAGDAKKAVEEAQKIVDGADVVKSVNGQTPDENGNVQIEVGSGNGVDVTAQPGQLIRVKEVDEEGKPTAWEAVDNSWDNLTNRPFGIGYGDTLTIEQIDPETFDPSTAIGGMMFKVSDAIITVDDLSNGLTVEVHGETIEVPPESAAEVVSPIVDGMNYIMDALLSVEEQAVGVEVDGLVFPESGLYANAYAMFEGSVVLTIPGFGKFDCIQTLDERYIPKIPSTKLPKNTINVQPDWNQTDEMAMDYIKNKPDNSVKHLYSKTVNGVLYVTEDFGGDAITTSRMQELADEYGADRLRIDWLPVFQHSAYDNIGYFCALYKNVSTSVTGISYAIRNFVAAEYTPT